MVVTVAPPSVSIRGMCFVSPLRTRVLLEVIRQEHPTIRGVATALGYQSPNSVHKHLKALRRAGLVDWVDTGRGTLHATVVAVKVRDRAS